MEDKSLRAYCHPFILMHAVTAQAMEAINHNKNKNKNLSSSIVQLRVNLCVFVYMYGGWSEEKKKVRFLWY